MAQRKCNGKRKYFLMRAHRSSCAIHLIAFNTHTSTLANAKTDRIDVWRLVCHIFLHIYKLLLDSCTKSYHTHAWVLARIALCAAWIGVHNKSPSVQQYYYINSNLNACAAEYGQFVILFCLRKCIPSECIARSVGSKIFFVRFCFSAFLVVSVYGSATDCVSQCRAEHEYGALCLCFAFFLQ